jgi:malate permease and related proteins
MLTVILAVVAPVAAILGVGFLWDRLRQPFDAGFIGSLVYFVGGPCLTFTTLVTFDFTPGALRLALATVALFVVVGIVGAVVLRALSLSPRWYLNTVLFPNLGNMGLPLAYFAYGDAGLALSVVIFTIGSVLHSTVGIWIVSGRLSPVELFKAPLLYATIAAITIHALALPAPDFLLQGASILGGMTIPLMLLSLGVSLSRMQVHNTRRAATLAGIRLGIGLSLGVAVAWMFDLSPLERGLLVLNSVMPAAVFNYLLAERFKAAPEDVAGAVALSTLAAFALLPFVLAFVV